MRYLRELNLKDRRLLIRLDLNVPLQDGVISSDVRIRSSLPTIKAALAARPAAVTLMSHLGRPREGAADPCYTLAPVAARLGELLERPVTLVRDWRAGLTAPPGALALLENVRFNRGESGDDEALARAYAGLCDVFVMDAFGSAHRAHASTHGVARHAPAACAGLLLESEIRALTRALSEHERPLVALIGGAKVSTRLATLHSLARRVDSLILGGGLANTCLAAAGHAVGRSLYEPEMLDAARRLLNGGGGGGCGAQVVLPEDVVVADAPRADAATRVCGPHEVAADEMILDVGPVAAAHYRSLLAAAATIIWSGPPGMFELQPFAAGTGAVARAVADSAAFSIAGGGDTLAAVEKFGIASGVSYISTGGGAFLEFIQGKLLPAIAMLEQRSKD